MGFFTSDFGLGEEYANPKVSQVYQPSGGAGATSPVLTSRQSASDPLGQLAKAMGGSTSGGYNWNQQQQGKGLSDLSGLIGGGGLGGGLGGFAPTAPTDTRPVTPPYIGSGDSGGDFQLNDGGLLTGVPQQNVDWNQARGLVSAFSPVAALAGDVLHGRIDAFGDYYRLPWYEGSAGDGYGYSPDDIQGGWDPSFDDYNTGDKWAVDSLSEMLGISKYTDMLSIDGMFGGSNIIDTDDVVFTAPVIRSPAQEYVIEDPKTQNIFTDVTETTAGGYTWDSDLGTVEEMQEETGLGTSEWDTSHADFSWGDDSSSSDDSSGGWGDSDAASDMDSDSGWSGADSDFDDSSSDSGGGDSGGDSGGGGSYIATAATQALGEEGLTIFEEWRDYMFTKLPTFTTSYGRYRVTAPKIVAEIDTKKNSKHIYNYIWDMHLKPIFDLIKEDKDSKKALKDYKIMVKELQNKFLKKEKV